VFLLTSISVFLLNAFGVITLTAGWTTVIVEIGVELNFIF